MLLEWLLLRKDPGRACLPPMGLLSALSVAAGLVPPVLDVWRVSPCPGHCLPGLLTPRGPLPLGPYLGLSLFLVLISCWSVSWF